VGIREKEGFEELIIEDIRTSWRTIAPVDCFVLPIFTTFVHCFAQSLFIFPLFTFLWLVLWRVTVAAPRISWCLQA
jgi:hypothetical protein